MTQGFDDSAHVSPAIVVVGFKRLDSLKRLLLSLEKAIYSEKITLVISIDYSAEADSLRSFVENYRWPHGPVEKIVHQKNLGLRKHIISCGDLTERFDSVVVLEDDLCVSPYFYLFASKAKSFYETSGDIAGIGLYSHSYNETAGLPFVPISDGSDVFFMQTACSWGQMWTKAHWHQFKQWLLAFNEDDKNMWNGIPENVCNWPKSSWKKLFIAYLIQTNKYFVYPRTSLTTNFSEPGSNYDFTEKYLQVPLENGIRPYHFSNFSDSQARYDAYCELCPELLLRLNPQIAKQQNKLVVDLYGTKPKSMGGDQALWITSKKSNKPLRKFELSLKPHELNIKHNKEAQDSGDIVLTYENDLEEASPSLMSYDQIHYYFGIPKELFVTRTAFETMKRKFLECQAELDAIQASTVWKWMKKIVQ